MKKKLSSVEPDQNVKQRPSLSSEDLLSFFKRGLIPGPCETEEQFLERVAAHPPLPEWKSVDRLPPSWGFSVDWVPLIYSKKNLLPWEGAVFRTSHIQLHPSLRSQKLYGYCLNDILHHESIHAARAAFDEPGFEEVLAYSTAAWRWRRFLGPLFIRIWEFPLFALSLFFLPYTFAIPVFFFLRLLYKQLLFERAQKKYPLPLLLCLTDLEIRALALSNKAPVLNSTPRSALISALSTSLKG